MLKIGRIINTSKLLINNAVFFLWYVKRGRGALDATNVIVIDCFRTKNVIQNENIKTVELVGCFCVQIAE